MTDKSVVPEGYVLVPIEPTDEMLAKAMTWFTAWSHMRAQDRRNAIANAWSAMLSAHSIQSGGEGGEG